MKSISSVAITAVAALLAAPGVRADSQTSQGCFKSLTGLIYNSTSIYNSKGYCGTQTCLVLGYEVFATGNKSMCYCSNTLPPKDTMVDDSLCNIKCPGYPDDYCGGGTSMVNVYLTGLTTAANNADDSAADKSAVSSSASSTATSSSTASVVTQPGATVLVTSAPQPAVSSSAAPVSSSGPSKGGIAAGVVVGLAAIAAISGGIFLFIRNRRRRQLEEEYRRNAAVSSFIAGKPPTSSGGASSFQDLRLDPAVMAQRRMSDGSIADNQDYSRRILKVTNA